LNFFRLKFLTLLLTFPALSNATHYKAGDITYKQTGAYSFEISLITYTDVKSIADGVDRNQVEIFWGDNNSDIISRQSQINIGNSVLKNVYVATHTYPGPGSYLISFKDHNRVSDILNITQSVIIPFYLETELNINPFRGINQSPQLLEVPICFARVGETFIYYPNAYDPDGDSLTFSIIPPKEEKGKNVPGFFIPPSTVKFHLDKHTGKITWETPPHIGIYNIAILVEEFRNGKKIGYVIRDMQIVVKPGDNFPPHIAPFPDTCVEAGTYLVVNVHATDQDVNDMVSVTATGGPFIVPVSPAYMVPDTAFGFPDAVSQFRWQTSCEHIRKHPYQVVFKAQDNNALAPLSDYEHFSIKVVGPAPKSLNSQAKGNGIELNWNIPDCQIAKGYLVYRKSGASGWDPSYCETGVPSYTGFTLIDTLVGLYNTYYLDNNKGNGLVSGKVYCYRVTAVYLNNGQYEIAEGYASNEICTEFIKDVPIITNVSIRQTGNGNGSLFLRWMKPVEIDTIQFPGPYKYKISRAANQQGTSLNYIADVTSIFFGSLQDSILIDTFLKTSSSPYSYKIGFFYTENGDLSLVEETPVASSVFLSILPANEKLNLTWKENVPWTNYQYIIYKQNKQTLEFDSIGFSTTQFYTDDGLENGETYCYYVKSVGKYSTAKIPGTWYNNSQKVCAYPIDTIPPCAPVATVSGFCETRTTNINWNIAQGCAEDLNMVKIYFSPGKNGQLVLIDSFPAIYNGSHTDMRQALQYSMAGCYYVSAVDSSGNESKLSEGVCVDNCPVYKLPNVFTPNGDNINDIFVPSISRFIEKVEMTIYNRWGQKVFSTNDPAINWNGEHFSGFQLPPGVYYYICRVHEIYLDGNRIKDLSGTIQLIR
jgi:gliding motility-associated-like protein